MASPAQKILEKALLLPEDERRRVAEALLESVPHESAEDIEDAWREEVMRRIEEVRCGVVEPEPWTEVKRHIRAALDR